MDPALVFPGNRWHPAGQGSPLPMVLDMDDDGLLLQRFRAGDGRAFEALVRRHQERVYRFLVAMVGDPALAEDLAQETFVKAARRVATLREPGAFGSWLLSIARFLAIDWLRRRTARGLDREGLPPEPAASRGAGPETRQAVRAVIACLSAQDREVLLLADLGGLAMAEIAEAVGISPSAAKMRLARARRRFRELYAQLTELGDG